VEEVLIIEKRKLYKTIGTSVASVDSSQINALQGNSLNDIALNNQLFFAKIYGQGQLATAAVRGGAADQMAILWNGISIQNTMNGNLDFNLMPIEFIDEVELQYGGNSAKWGSGAITGNLFVNNINPLNRGSQLEVGNATTSFENGIGLIQGMRNSIKYGYSKHNLAVKLRAFRFVNNNQFPFYNPFQDKIEHLQNSKVEQKGMLGEVYYKPAQNQEINLRLWLQDSDRQIPPIINITPTEIYQKDATFRLMADYQYSAKKWNLIARSAYFNENIVYNNLSYKLYSFSRAHTWSNEIEHHWYLHKNHSIMTRLFNYHSLANVKGTEGYGEERSQDRTGVFINYKSKFAKEKWQIESTLRLERWQQKWLSPTPFVGQSFQIFSWFHIFQNASLNYRLPTFNDLYWIPGGNPNLKEEKSYHTEIGLGLDKVLELGNNMSLQFKIQNAIYYTLVNDKIVWSPSNFGYYSAFNIRQVEMKGFDTRISSSLKLREWQISLSGNYDHNIAQTLKSEEQNMIGKQLIFIPIQRSSVNLGLRYRNIEINCAHIFQGYRFIATDNSDFLPAYQLTNMNAGYYLKIKNAGFKINFQVNNLFNTSYVVLPARAMPLRNYQVSIVFNFNQKPKK
jgi:iron complex outermembrane receptor protein